MIYSYLVHGSTGIHQILEGTYILVGMIGSRFIISLFVTDLDDPLFVRN